MLGGKPIFASLFLFRLSLVNDSDLYKNQKNYDQITILYTPSPYRDFVH